MDVSLKSVPSSCGLLLYLYVLLDSLLLLIYLLIYFGYLMRRANSLGKTLMLGEIEGRKRRGRKRMRWLDGITNSMHMSWSELWEIVKDRHLWGHKESDMT